MTYRTYRDRTGRFQDMADELTAKLSEGGERGPKLERFQHAMECYFDLFNNGMFDRMAEILTTFDIRWRLAFRTQAQAIKRIEPEMDRLVWQAYYETFGDAKTSKAVASVLESEALAKGPQKKPKIIQRLTRGEE